MIWYYVILFFTSIFTAAFSWLDKVTTLPTILGVDIDTVLSQGVGEVYYIGTYIWPLKDVFIGAIFLLAYFIGKNIILRMFLGHRISQ